MPTKLILFLFLAGSAPPYRFRALYDAKARGRNRVMLEGALY